MAIRRQTVVWNFQLMPYLSKDEYFRVTGHGADGLIVPMPATNTPFFLEYWGGAGFSEGINLSKTGLIACKEARGSYKPPSSAWSG